MSRLATYAGECPACGDKIEADYDTITFDEKEGEWVHEACFVDPFEETKRKSPNKLSLAERIKLGQLE